MWVCRTVDHVTQVLTAEVSQGIIDSCNFGLTSDNTDDSLLTELRNTLIGTLYMISLISNLYTFSVSDVMLMGCLSVTWEAVSEMCMFTRREVDLPLLTSSSRIRTRFRASSVVAVTPLVILDSLVYIALKWVWIL